FMEGINRDNEITAKIINDPEEPTFENTIIRVDREKGDEYYELLERVSTVFFNMLSANTNDEMDELAQKMSPILTQHANDIMLNEDLFKRVKYVYEHHRELTPEEQMLLDKQYDGFVRSGALLDKEGKEKLRQLTEEASLLSLQFSQNLLKENKAFKLHITDEKQLDGLPETARQAAAMTAKEDGVEGWVFSLDGPSYSPFMTYSSQRDLREKMFMARNTVCTHDNNENNVQICQRLVNLRREVAQLLGYDCFADYVLKHRMASDVEHVYQLFNNLLEAYTPTAIEEVKEVEEIAKEDLGDQEMMPWDFGYYSHKLQMKKYNLDSEMLRPYFQLDKVIDGVFGLANRLYGITFKENKDIAVYHPDVKAYEVFDKDGSYLAVFYADFHPRKSKQGGAWMTEYQGQWIDEKGVNNRPHVSVVMNLTKPTEEKPALLTLGEVETFLHEFGHSLHGMFANTRFESLSGTNVWWDFVELPSQFMENFAIEKEFLRTFAFHYQTGEPLPDELIERIIHSRNFMAAYS
ncbi:MAG: M3 family metallopeptidase, partial [Prevotella sp.]|nr:M3 family metallopeptidase [Prevotella sp.]